MLESACTEFGNQISLVEIVGALDVMIVGGQTESACVADCATRKNVLIELVVLRCAERVLQLQAIAKVMINDGVEAIDRILRDVLVRTAEELAARGFVRTSILRRNAAVHETLVIKIFIAERE